MHCGRAIRVDFTPMLTYPEIDPIIFSIGPLAVRWYGLMYVVGFVAGWFLAGTPGDRRKLVADQARPGR